MGDGKNTTQSLFFPFLKRPTKYSSKPNGEFYAYRYYRENYQHEIAEACECRCVYCDSHENEAGGRDSMQLDHFRPNTLKGFEKLEDDPSNFHHACGRCNLLKSDKWPSSHATEPHDGVVGFVDPFADDRRNYFGVENNGELKPLRAPAKYLIRVLALNRPHLKLLRQKRIYEAELCEFVRKNAPQWEAVAQGRVEITKEAFDKMGKDLMECKRLIELCSIGQSVLKSR
jgi:hypothetical protein